MSKAIDDVIAERQRQINVEGYDLSHDDGHRRGDLAQAGASYALRASGYLNAAHDYWPWEDSSWKPKDMRSDLVRAAALIIAEIERFDRK